MTYGVWVLSQISQTRCKDRNQRWTMKDPQQSKTQTGIRMQPFHASVCFSRGPWSKCWSGSHIKWPENTSQKSPRKSTATWNESLEGEPLPKPIVRKSLGVSSFSAPGNYVSKESMLFSFAKKYWRAREGLLRWGTMILITQEIQLENRHFSKNRIRNASCWLEFRLKSCYKNSSWDVNRNS